MSLLIANDLKLEFENQLIYGPLNFTVKSGQILGIMGPNGGGKSSLARTLAGINNTSSGSLHWGENFNLERDLSYVPQSESIVTILPMTLKEYLYLCAQNKQEEARINEYLEIAGLKSKQNFQFSRLSGGEKQRCLLIKALIKYPKLLILDEPFTGLDSEGTDFLLKILKADQHKSMAIIIIDHNINYLLNNCDHILCLNKHAHWHHPKGAVSQQLIDDIYHCELEHQLIHQQSGPEIDHHQCNVHDHHNHDESEDGGEDC